MHAEVIIKVDLTVDDKLTKDLSPAERRELVLTTAKEKISRLGGDRLEDAIQGVECDQPIE